ncbi:MAG: TIGR01777 family oxidoreductase [Flavobacteriaceae bacterium]|nr:TIGR01777 family oxidoreductase [Flavobacteriaceae bacterium]
MQKILITGATGLVGQEIVKHCHEQNIAVNYLSTSKSKLENKPNYKGFYWNPSFGEIDVNCFKNVDVIINLAGASIAQRWTKSYKEEILKSRVEALQLLYKTIETENISIKHLVSASAIGIYPDSLTHYYEEDFNDFDDGFLSHVVSSWEHEANQFKSLNIKVSKIRIGIVLSEKGGALPQLVKPIRWFVGSALGCGNQWQSWIHIEDLAAIFMYVIKHTFEGVFNAVAPNAVPQKDMVKNIGRVVKRPILLPAVPSFILKLVLGEMSALVLESQRVSCNKIENLGFSFKYYYLQPALEDLL